MELPFRPTPRLQRGDKLSLTPAPSLQLSNRFASIFHLNIFSHLSPPPEPPHFALNFLPRSPCSSFFFAARLYVGGVCFLSPGRSFRSRSPVVDGENRHRGINRPALFWRDIGLLHLSCHHCCLSPRGGPPRKMRKELAVGGGKGFFVLFLHSSSRARRKKKVERQKLSLSLTLFVAVFLVILVLTI